MSYLTAEQMVAAHKANVETLFGLTQKAFEGVEKLVELNIQVAKTAMVEAADTTKAALSVKDAQELLALQQAMLCTRSHLLCTLRLGSYFQCQLLPQLLQ